MLDRQANDPLATSAELAALEFGPMGWLRSMSQGERIVGLAEIVETLHAPLAAAGEILSFDKAELTARTREPGGASEAVLTILADAVARARAIVELLVSAECRLAAARRIRGRMFNE